MPSVLGGRLLLVRSMAMELPLEIPIKSSSSSLSSSNRSHRLKKLEKCNRRVNLS